MDHDDDLLNEIFHQQARLLITLATVAANTNSFIEDDEMDLEDQNFVDPEEGVRD